DVLALVAERDDELLEARLRVMQHDVQEDGHSSDLHHRLRPDGRLLGEARPLPSSENRHFHGTDPYVAVVPCPPAGRGAVADPVGCASPGEDASPAVLKTCATVRTPHA